MIDTNKGIIAWFARNSVAANLLMIIIMIVGFASAFSIKKEMFPSIEPKTITIRVAYPGAAPKEVEEGIIDKVEEVLQDVEGKKKITSTASEGMGTVLVEVEDGYELQELMDEVKGQVDSISSFPNLAEKPIVYRSRYPRDVLWLSIYGDLDERGLKEFAKEVRDELKLLPDVSKVKLVGERQYEVGIEISEYNLRQYELTFDDVVNAVRRSSLDLPGGTIKSEAGNFLLRTKGQAYRANDFANIVLRTAADGTRILLSDVATINDSFVDEVNYSMFNGKPSVSVQISASGDESVFDVAKAVKAYVAEKKQTLPDSVTLDHWGDSSFYLQGRLDLMLNNMFFGGLLVLLALTLFLDLKVALWVIIGIPICFLGALALMPLEYFDVSINVISLFGFILVLGIVVDDAIIIGESVYTEIEKRGHSADTVIIGTKKVATPATFGVLTTIAAFVPMMMVSGNFGTIWKAIAMVVSLCLLFSIIESKYILPAHLVKMKVRRPDEKQTLLYRTRAKFSGMIRHLIQHKYQPLLIRAVENRYTTLMIFIGMFSLVLALLAGGHVRTVFFPNIPSDFIQAKVEMMEGTPSETTVQSLKKIEQSLLGMDQQLKEEFGTSVVKHRLSWNESETVGSVFVELEKSEGREINGFEIVNRWRESVPEIAGLKSASFSASISGPKSDISFQLKGKSLDDLKEAAQELKQKLNTYNGVFDIQDSFSGGNDEILLSIKPEAEALGLSLSDLANQVRQGFYGAEAQRIQRDGEEIKVMVRYPESERRSIGNLENMRIRTINGDEVPFSSVATFTTEPGYSSINRIDGVRSVTVTASVDKGRVEPQKVTQEINQEFMPELRQRHPSVSTALEGSSKEEQDLQGEMLKALGLALFLIYALMAIPLKSYSQPLIIMSVIPFGLIGAIFGHLVLGLSVSILSLFGIIALSGVVVNDSLILVDFVNREVKQGMPVKEAVIESGAQRFRPIILTSLTTFFGLTPIVLEKSLQAQIVIPMAVSLAFGILFATVITLLLIPSLYVILDDIRRGFRWIMGKEEATSTSTV
ncbi:efflux RND transporter permease subunit [Algicola sagamiensis]|uniref:efflux RND transporter permease subunit n=1 Tax=Algicola sagamiensis TaxID=163869 RepID=UPI00036E2D6E|nr:efflux RND transporter permease subunit [Algicola sagamiensis]